MSDAPEWSQEEVEEPVDPRIEQLHEAAREGRLDRVRSLLDGGLAVDATGSRFRGRMTALMAAVGRNHLDVIRELLERGADANFGSEIDRNALTLAVSWNNPRWRPIPDPRPLELLLAAGARLRLYEAVLTDDLDLARTRLEEGADPDFAQWSYHGPVLMIAAGEGFLAMVDLLLDFGANIEATDDLGTRPLMRAAGRGRAEVVARLLDRGADLDGTSWSHQTALAEAASGGHLDLARWLIERGARRTIVDALLLGERDLFRQLLDEALVEGRKVDDLSDGRFRLALVAARHGDPEIIRLLLDHDAQVLCPRRTNGHSLLAEAARHGHLAAMQALLDRGADLHAVGRDGLTPLAWALRENRAEAADLLRSAGATR